MKTEENLIYFETAKLVKELGYSNGSEEQYCQYFKKYVYDSDPNHPESHKVGDIRVYNFYCKNNAGDLLDSSNETHYCCEIPTLNQIQKWLINVHGVAVLVDLDCTLSWIWKIIPMDPGSPIQEYHQSKEVWCGFNEIDVCLEDGIFKCLNLIKEKNK